MFDVRGFVNTFKRARVKTKGNRKKRKVRLSPVGNGWRDDRQHVL